MVVLELLPTSTIATVGSKLLPTSVPELLPRPRVLTDLRVSRIPIESTQLQNRNRNSISIVLEGHWSFKVYQYGTVVFSK
ncbi:hypothetical protein L1987_60306 [Smallanthus sonchifolius]|uniref:Uncharacterized protein n=1 Tax=Smallanthus sonchifolius TaxID=185202 RepID=A0ACB9D8J3_9ASTR|nr:hypothetical protein L1987_60306 [Smallanthus sonchifolius]